MILLIISFFSGVLTVLAPCILPVLPIIVGGSLADGKIQKSKVFTILGSLITSILLFTFLLKASALLINIPPHVWQWISGGIIIFLGVIMLFPRLWENRFFARMSGASQRSIGANTQKQNLWGNIMTGAALGPVFSTCSPTYFIVLASVLPASPITGFIYLLAYALGLALALLVVTYAGQKILTKLNIAADAHGIFKRVIGILFIIVGLLIFSGVDKKIEAQILKSGFFDVTKVENRLLELRDDDMIEQENEEIIIPEEMSIKEENIVQKKDLTPRYIKAPEITSPSGFINTNGEAITLAQFRGTHVVLLDVWTYSCVNCQRSLPHVVEWYEKYKDEGLVVIGLHTPEFSYEENINNVQNAVERYGITYPVVLDNDYATWRALGNRYWPRKYLIDQDGNIIYDHIGEGNYAETEQQIRSALEKLHQ
jgi:cytochrome c biogenesis protein CcdA/thiol-disulfide isomerase/thioredoxin